MRSTFAGLALVAAVAAKPVPQSSSSCQTSMDGAFNIQVINSTSTPKQKRQAIVLSMTLSDGGLIDSEGRIGYIASNKQFQFDAGEPQAGAEGVNGFAVCGGYLAHDGDVTTWDACKSGGFSNLYSDNSIAAGNPGQCTPVNIQVLPADGSAASASAPAASASAASSAPATQITDGQPQATVASAPVTQITDGQPQATVASAPVTQITDGQVQATVASAPVATQITDGQVQATVASAPVAACTQIVDGQPQCPVASGTGALPYPGANSTVVGAAPSSSVVPATGAASSFSIGSSVVGLVAAVAALAMF